MDMIRYFPHVYHVGYDQNFQPDRKDAARSGYGWLQHVQKIKCCWGGGGSKINRKNNFLI